VRYRRLSVLSSERGFTLVEMLIVMVVLAILMTIAVPSYIQNEIRAQDTTAISNGRLLHKLIEQCVAIQGSFTTGVGGSSICDGELELVAINGGPHGLPYGANFSAPPNAGKVDADPCQEVNTPAPTCAAAIDGFTALSRSQSGTTFYVSRSLSAGTPAVQVCAPAGFGRCRANGTW